VVCIRSAVGGRKQRNNKKYEGFILRRVSNPEERLLSLFNPRSVCLHETIKNRWTEFDIREVNEQLSSHFILHLDRAILTTTLHEDLNAFLLIS
jgi:hypothetical protein